MKHKQKKTVVITGAESSGKSTLARKLCGHYDQSYQDEYAREYLKTIGTKYSELDLVKIAKGQWKLQQQKLERQYDVSIFDTDLLNIKIWAEYRFGSCPYFISELLLQHLPDLYLICSPDIPWEDDPLREAKHARQELFDIHVSEVKKLCIPYSIITGNKQGRFDSSITQIGKLLKGLN